MFKKIKLNIVCIAVFSALAVGCSDSGSSSGDSNPTAVTPDPVTPDPVTPDPVTPDPVTPDPVTPDPVTPDPVIPDPITPDPVTPDPNFPDPTIPDPGMSEPPVNDGVSSDLGVVEDLLGRTLLFFGFFDTAPVFVTDVTFTQQSIVTDSGNTLLVSNGNLLVRESEGSEFLGVGEVTLLCLSLNDSVGYCVFGDSDGGTSNFAFEALENGESSGLFEFCPAGLDTESCLGELFSENADGFVAVVNGPANAAVASFASTERTSINDPFSKDTMQYLEQGSSSANSSGASVGFADIDTTLIIEAMKTMKAMSQ